MRPGVGLLSVCLSGSAALTYQVIWIRMLGWFFDPEQDGEVTWVLFCVDAAGRRAWAELVARVCPDPVRHGIARKTLDAEPPRR